MTAVKVESEFANRHVIIQPREYYELDIRCLNDALMYMHLLNELLTCDNFYKFTSFSSPEATLLLVSTKNYDLWPSPRPEVRDSRTSRHSAHVQSQV